MRRLLLGRPQVIRGQEADEHAEAEEHGLHSADGLYDNELSVFIGNTNKGDENSWTLGFDYVREVTHKLGVGIFFDWASNHHERSFIVGVPAFFKPLPGIHVGGGPWHRA